MWISHECKMRGFDNLEGQHSMFVSQLLNWGMVKDDSGGKEGSRE